MTTLYPRTTTKTFTSTISTQLVIKSLLTTAFYKLDMKDAVQTLNPSHTPLTTGLRAPAPEILRSGFPAL